MNVRTPGGSDGVDWHTVLYRALTRSVHDARLLGAIFMGLWALLVLLSLGDRRGIPRLLIGATSTVMLAPGVLYWVAAAQLERRRPSGAAMARWAAAAHAGVTLVLLAAAFTPLRQFSDGVFIAPAIVSVFFVPALIAFLVQTFRAEEAARRLEAPGRAFEPLAVRPVPSAEPPDQDIRDTMAP